MDEQKNKKIDEAWKEAIEKEKAKEKEGLGKDAKFLPPEPDFSFFISTLALQVTIALGQIPNPATNEKQVDLAQAKFIIDTLGMLKEKTKTNLNKEESDLLGNLLYELRMQYINKTKEKEAHAGGS